MLIRLISFLVLNFLALGLGGFFTGTGVRSEWYAELSKAPWTPPGWFFGFAWTSIMICYGFYMSYLWKTVVSKREIILLFALQWILNVLWNPLFFHFRQTGISMLEITLLTILIGLFLFRYRNTIQWKSLLILPYFIWLLVASSLNAWILLYN